jgi:hypothetical protein
MNKYSVTGGEGQDFLATVGFYFSRNPPNPLYKRGNFLIISLPPVEKGGTGGFPQNN